MTKIDFEDAGDFFAHERRYDLVLLHLVLQRMPPREGLELLRHVAERVALGGVGVFHVPFRKTSQRALEAVRWTRAHVPGANAAFNAARRKRGMPFFPTYIYDLNEVFSLLRDAGFETPYVVMQRHGDVDGAIVHAQRERKFVSVDDAPVEAAPAPRPTPASSTCGR